MGYFWWQLSIQKIFFCEEAGLERISESVNRKERKIICRECVASYLCNPQLKKTKVIGEAEEFLKM